MKAEESSSVLASPRQRPGLDPRSAGGAAQWATGLRSQSRTPSRAPLTLGASQSGGAQAKQGSGGATRPSGPSGPRGFFASSSLPPGPGPHMLPPQALDPPVAATGWGTPGARRPRGAVGSGELNPNICVHNAPSEAYSCRDKGKKGRGGILSHVDDKSAEGSLVPPFLEILAPSSQSPSPTASPLFQRSGQLETAAPLTRCAACPTADSPGAPQAPPGQHPRGPASRTRRSLHRSPASFQPVLPQTCPAPRAPLSRFSPGNPGPEPPARAQGTGVSRRESRACRVLAWV